MKVLLYMCGILGDIDFGNFICIRCIVGGILFFLGFWFWLVVIFYRSKSKDDREKMELFRFILFI